MTTNEQAALDTVLNFLQSYSKKDVEGCMAAIATSRPVLLLGTNADEVFRSPGDFRSALSRDFASMDDVRWGAQRDVHVVANAALASVVIEVPLSYLAEGKKTETLFRYALTLAKEGERWKICSGMASVPAPAGTCCFTK
jgi:hypothetical protein